MARNWNETELTLENAKQAAIKPGDLVRSYDFPGSRDDEYIEGIVIERNDASSYVLIHVTRDVQEGVEQMVGARLKVRSPFGVGSFSAAPALFLLKSK